MMFRAPGISSRSQASSSGWSSATRTLDRLAHAVASAEARGSKGTAGGEASRPCDARTECCSPSRAATIATRSPQFSRADFIIPNAVPVPAEPIIFLKTPDTVVGPDDEVLIPRRSTKTDWEVELAVVIGSTARYLDLTGQAAGDWDVTVMNADNRSDTLPAGFTIETPALPHIRQVHPDHALVGDLATERPEAGRGRGHAVLPLMFPVGQFGPLGGDS